MRKLVVLLSVVMLCLGCGHSKKNVVSGDVPHMEQTTSPKQVSQPIAEEVLTSPQQEVSEQPKQAESPVAEVLAGQSAKQTATIGKVPSVQSPSPNKTVDVKGYTRKDGTYVQPYTRSAPGSKK